MNLCCLVTPFFFDEHDPRLREAVPSHLSHATNEANSVVNRTPECLSRTHGPIADFVSATVKRGEIPMSIAGDCAASLPVVAGLQSAGIRPVLVWLDAHGDFNTPETSPSGFLGGMPLAMMVGRGDLSLAQTSGQTPVSEQDVWLVDARDLDPLEEVALGSSQINRISIEALSELVLDRPVYLHIDNDIIDAEEVPANNYPVPNGPSLNAVIENCIAFASQNSICAISLSGWNGHLDSDGETGRACQKLLSSIASVLNGKKHP
ncbi:arginase family protein [Cochlodiniinecator piscidefendens]|uniref:arginase family protein n=1 Tax=Cochlodiniinecator piscidefendens TaxID=2715756 RepID=UPI00140DCEEF|nr:arginase family protein [Cochlodiniinecator piscidefendens]